MLIPCRSKDTSVRSDCSGSTVDGPVTVWGHFSQRTPTETPLAGLRGHQVRGPLEVESGEGCYLPLLLLFVLLFVVTTGGFGLEGSILPPLPRQCPGGTLGPSPLPLCT
jgi:hypothetical protein